MNETDSRRVLGAFLRAHRGQIAPPARAATRRRTPGLRREELADICGVSTTWITWLEQGRNISASPTALARLAEALHLAPAERAYLFDLAGKRDPAAPLDNESDVPLDLLNLPSIVTVPAYLLDQTWTALAWNPAAARLFVGWLDGREERNLLRFIFLSSAARSLIADWEERARRVVAEFRADYSRQLHDPLVRAVVDDLSEQSPIFLRYWSEQMVLHREGGERRFNHPLDGVRRYHQTTLLAVSHPDCKLVCLSPIE